MRLGKGRINVLLSALMAVIVVFSQIVVSEAVTYSVYYDETEIEGIYGTEVVKTVRFIENGDSKAPVITLTGDSTLNLIAGYEDYTELGAMVTDDIDTDLEVKITYTKDDVELTAIATSESGTYIVHYNASDLAGNKAAEVTREVIVGSFIERYQVTYGDIYDENDSLDSKIDLEPFLYHFIDYFEDGDEDVYRVDSVYTDEILLDKVTSYSDSTYCAEDINDYEYEFSSLEIPILYNYEEIVDSGDLLQDSDLKVIYADTDDLYRAGIEGNENGRFDSDEIVGIIATEITDLVMVDCDYEIGDTKIEANSDIRLPLDFDGNFDTSRLVVTGDVDSVKNIKENDVIEVYEPYNYYYDDDDGDTLHLVVSRNTVQGELEEIDLDDDTITINGIELDYSDFVYYSDFFNLFDLGDEFTVYLNSEGDIAFIEEYEDNLNVLFGVVAAAANGTMDEAFGNIYIDEYPQIKILTSDGNVTVFDVAVTDFDFYDGMPQTVSMGDMVLTWDGNIYNEIAIANIEDFEGQLVEYTINGEGVVTKVNISYGLTDYDYFQLSGQNDSVYNEPILNNSHLVTPDTLIFDITESDEDDWNLIDMDDIDLFSSSVEISYLTESGESYVLYMVINGNNYTPDTSVVEDEVDKVIDKTGLGVFAESANGSVDSSFSVISIDDAPQIKFLSEDGDIIIYDISTDDFDFESISPQSVSIGDLSLSWDGDENSEITVDNSTSFNNKMIEYKVYDTGKIAEINLLSDKVDLDYYTLENESNTIYIEQILDNAYSLTSDTIIFDITNSDEREWYVIDVTDIDLFDTDVNIHYVTENDENIVKVMTIEGNDYTVGNTGGENIGEENQQDPILADRISAVFVAGEDGYLDSDFGSIYIDNAPQIKVFTEKGDIVIYDVYTDGFDFNNVSSQSISIGNLDLTWNGTEYDAIELANVSELENRLVEIGIDEKGNVIEFNLASNLTDECDYTQFSNVSDSIYEETIMNDSYIVDNETLIFDITETDEDNWRIIGKESINLDDVCSIAYITEKDSSIISVMVIDGNDPTSEEYGMILDVSYVLNGDDDVVQKLIGFVDGTERIMYTDGSYSSEVYSSQIESRIFELILDEGAVTEISEKEAEVSLDIVTDILESNGSYLKVGGTLYEVENDCVVYELIYAKDGDIESVIVSTFENIAQDGMVSLYKTDNSESGDEIDIIIYVSEESVDNGNLVL